MLEQLAELDKKYEITGSREVAEVEYRKIFDETSLRLVTGAGTPEDAKALKGSGETLARIILSHLHDATSSSQRESTLDKTGMISKALDAIIYEVGVLCRGKKVDIEIRNKIYPIIRPYLRF